LPFASIDEIRARIGEDLGASDWLLVDQARIDAFAAATEDHQFIHTDPAQAAQTPFGGTIAHGFLTLSLLSRMAVEVMLYPHGVQMGVNYGFDRVRFLSPVRAGSRIRGHFRLTAFDEKRPGQWQHHYDVTVEIEGKERPALHAEWIGMMFT